MKRVLVGLVLLGAATNAAKAEIWKHFAMTPAGSDLEIDSQHRVYTSAANRGIWRYELNGQGWQWADAKIGKFVLKPNGEAIALPWCNETDSVPICNKPLRSVAPDGTVTRLSGKNLYYERIALNNNGDPVAVQFPTRRGATFWYLNKRGVRVGRIDTPLHADEIVRANNGTLYSATYSTGQILLVDIHSPKQVQEIMKISGVGLSVPHMTKGPDKTLLISYTRTSGSQLFQIDLEKKRYRLLATLSLVVTGVAYDDELDRFYIRSPSSIQYKVLGTRRDAH